MEMFETKMTGLEGAFIDLFNQHPDTAEQTTYFIYILLNDAF